MFDSNQDLDGGGVGGASFRKEHLPLCGRVLMYSVFQNYFSEAISIIESFPASDFLYEVGKKIDLKCGNYFVTFKIVNKNKNKKYIL